MVENLAQNLRDQESAAKEIVAKAKAEAARTVAEARGISEQEVKVARQKTHRRFREEIVAAEKEAEGKATAIVTEGKEKADAHYRAASSQVEDISDWIVKEVMATYGVS